MQIKLISKTELLEYQNFDDFLKNLLKKYRNADEIEYIQNDLSLLNHVSLSFEVCCSMNLAFHLYQNKNFYINNSTTINGLESFNILIKDKPLKTTELDVIKQYVMDGYGLFKQILQRNPVVSSVSNILPFCHTRDLMISSSLKGWIEFIVMISHNENNDELLELKLLKNKIKNSILELYPTISKIFNFEKELEYEYTNSDAEIKNKQDKLYSDLDKDETLNTKPKSKPKKSTRKNAFLLK